MQTQLPHFLFEIIQMQGITDGKSGGVCHEADASPVMGGADGAERHQDIRRGQPVFFFHIRRDIRISGNLIGHILKRIHKQFLVLPPAPVIIILAQTDLFPQFPSVFFK